MADIRHPHTQEGSMLGKEAPVKEVFDVDVMNVRKEYFKEPIAPAQGSVTLSAAKNESPECGDKCDKEEKTLFTRLDKLAFLGAGANAAFNFVAAAGARAMFQAAALTSGQPMLGGEWEASAVSFGVVLISTLALAAIYKHKEKLTGHQTAGAIALFGMAGMLGGAVAMNPSIINFSNGNPFSDDTVLNSFNLKMEPVRVVENFVNTFRIALHI